MLEKYLSRCCAKIYLIKCAYNYLRISDQINLGFLYDDLKDNINIFCFIRNCF